LRTDKEQALDKKIATLVLLAALAGAGPGQPAPDAAQPLTVRAAAWGQVARPGQYDLGGTADLFELLSAAGGPTSGADLSRVVLIREQDGTRRRLNISAIAASGRPFFVVPGDVVIVPESFWSGFARNLPVISTLAVVANLVVSVLIVTRQ
jgi:hypothetical protein